MPVSPRRYMNLGETSAGTAPSAHPSYLVCKFASEWFLSLVLLLCAIPFLFCIAILVKLTSTGPVFYCQLRLGKNGKIYKVYKIRTMLHECEGAAGAVWAVQDDPRVTAIGRFLRETHIDEIPQLWNVLRGEMSLIGPRPERPEIASQLEQYVPAYRQRLVVRPGMTGLAQLRLPADSDVNGVRRKLSHDLYYIHHRGFLLDLEVAVSTIPYLLARVAKLFSELLIRNHGLRAEPHRKPVMKTHKLELRILDVDAGRAVTDGAQAA